MRGASAQGGAVRPAAVARGTVLGLVLLAGLAGAPAGRAEGLKISANVGAELAFGVDNLLGFRRNDWVAIVKPGVRVVGGGPDFNVDGRIDLAAATHSERKEDDRVSREANLNASVAVIRDVFTIEGGVRALQTAATPLSLSPDVINSSEAVDTTQWRLAPVLDVRLPADVRLNVRSTNTRTSANASTFSLAPTNSVSYFQDHIALAERKGPFGRAFVQLRREATRFVDSPQAPLQVDSARVGGSLQATPEVSIGARAGRERINQERNRETNQIVGLDVEWTPTPRTLITAQRERRFFGPAWGAVFTHRMPSVSWRLEFARDLKTSPQLLLELPATDNVTGLLNSMLTTRYPDPVAREGAVNDLIRRFGLPTSLSAASNVYTQSQSIVTTRGIQAAFGGALNTLVLSASFIRTIDAFESSPFADTFELSSRNNSQRAFALNYSRRLADGMSGGLTLGWRRSVADVIGLDDGFVERRMQAQVSRIIGPHTVGRLSTGYRESRVNQGGVVKEALITLGVDQTFD